MNHEAEVKHLLGVISEVEIEIAPGIFQKIWICPELPEGMIYLVDLKEYQDIRATLLGELRTKLGRDPMLGTWNQD